MIDLNKMNEYTGPIQADLDQFSTKLNDYLQGDSPLITSIARHLLKSRGKRIRPVFLFLSSRAAGNFTEYSVDASLAIELIHTATLLHDDVVDESDLRRGRQTVNAQWTNLISVLMGDYLFAKDKRADSHGCMRVEDPVKYAEVLLSIVRPSEGYTQDRIRRMVGAYEADIQFPTFIPVHLTYQTAFVDDRGTLEFREDVYGRDQALLAILRGGERKVADIPVQRHDNPTRRQLLAIPDNNWGGWGGRGYAASGSNFFTRLFSGPAHPVQVPRQPVVQQRTYYQQ